MSDETWLREALRRATWRQPVAGDRVRGAFALARRRRQQGALAASCLAVVAVLVATSLTGSGPGSAGLQPVAPGDSPTATSEPSATATDTPPDEANPPADDQATTEPDDEAGSPVPIDPELPVRPPSANGAPVDVYVLLDATGSMQSGAELDPKVRSVYDRLRADGADLRWGLGTFRDIDIGDLGHTYVQVRDLAAEYAAVADVIPAGGGGDPGEADTIALDGALGIGHVPYTKDGEGASFRAKAHKVVILFTDAPMARGDQYPTIESTVARLKAANVTVVAVQVTSSSDPEPGTYRDLAEVVGGTGGFTAGPVDCDGDGHRDVARDRPLVCGSDYDDADLSGLADAIVRLVLR